MTKPARVAILLILAVAACGGGSSSSNSATTTTTTTAAPKGPPSGAIAVTGDPVMTGNLTRLAISCANPGIDGSTITVTGSPPGQDPATAPFFTLFLSTGTVFVRISTGSGADFKVREFTGTTGLSGFDAATGAQIDSPLSETTPAGSNKGDLGAVTAIKGSVDCGNFAPGIATMRLSGDTADGAVNGTLDPVLVTCTTNQQGNFVIVRGIVNVGSAKAMFFVTTQPDGTLTIFETVQTSTAQRQYQGPPGSGSPTTVGTKVMGDAVEQNATPPHTLHVEGDATCGSNGK
ncbi:MAG: hypothetical protein QOG30_2446 [Acidimicrobiaceae bacterium]